MLCTDTGPRPGFFATADEPLHVAAPVEEPLRLAALDTTTLRALADAGYVHSADYVAIARARGVSIPETAVWLDRDPKAWAAQTERMVVVLSLPAETDAARLGPGLGIPGGQIEGIYQGCEVVHAAASGRLTLPARNTQMQHQRPRTLPQPMLA